MKRLSYLLFLLPLSWMMACSGDKEEEEDTYPSVVTELVMLHVDEYLRTTIQTDNGTLYSVVTELEGLEPNFLKRYLCSFLITERGEADIYTLLRIRILQDMTEDETSPVFDPVGLVSIWKKGHFINLHLLPKTKGNPALHGWGFIQGTLRTNSAGGNTYPLKLFHEQGDDPLAYSSDLYMSLHLDSLKTDFSDNDSIELTIQEFDKPHTWSFCAK